MRKFNRSIIAAMATGLAALLIASAAMAQTNGGPALLPPDQLFAPPPSGPQQGQAPGKFQALYNDASLCSGLSARLRASAGVFAARALTESTRAQRAGDAQTAMELRDLFTYATGVRDSAFSAHQTLENFRTKLAQLNSVSDAGGQVLFIAGGRRVTPMQFDNLPTGGQQLTDAMMVHANALLDDFGAVSACMTAVGNVEITGP